MSEPQFAPLEEWMESIIDYRGKTPEKTTAGIPLITAKVIKGGRIETPSEFIAVDAYEEWMRRGIPEAGDVVITTEAPLGEVAQLPKGKVALAQRVITLRGKKGLVDNTFLKYLLLSRPFQEDLEARATGTTVVGIKQSVLRKIDLSFPSFLEQKAFAHILGTLDDKIELNRKTNETLEAMAKALFKSWFVDFDPVRAKAEGRPTGLPAEISDLFPDSFEDSELGEIPSGWEISLLGDHIDLIKGRSYKSDELNPSTTALVNLKSFHRNGGYRPDGLKGFTGEYKEQQVVKPGELVIALTDVTQAAEVIGRPAIVKSDSHCSTLVASLDVGIVRPKATGCLSTPYLYFLMLAPRYVQHILGYTSGTTVLHLAKDGASNFPLPIGSLPLLNHFAQLADSILRQVDASARQSELLAKTRDALLPKLISGEIRIPDAEKMLEEVGV